MCGECDADVVVLFYTPWVETTTIFTFFVQCKPLSLTAPHHLTIILSRADPSKWGPPIEFWGPMGPPPPGHPAWWQVRFLCLVCSLLHRWDSE